MTFEIQTQHAIEVGTNKTVAIKSNGTEELGMQKAVSGLRLVHVSRKVRSTEIREATTGRPVAVPRIWAVAEPVRVPAQAEAVQSPKPKLELAFYRKYTEAMLRRYLRVSMEVGRVPSVMGREMFRGNVSHYRATGLEDAVIFCVDVERCLEKLRKDHLRLIRRIALQGYTLQEAAPRLSLDFRRCHEQYGRALDQLTEMFLAGRLLEPQKCCQAPETV